MGVLPARSTARRRMSLVSRLAALQRSMSGDRPRVLHVGPIPPPTDGGIAAYLDGLLHSPIADAVDLHTFDVRVPRWSQRFRPLRAWTSAQFLSGLARTLDTNPPDLVHIHASAYLSFWEKSAMGQLARRRGIPWILHLHDGFFESFLRNLRQPFATWAYRSFGSAARVLTVCHAWKPWLAEWVTPGRLVGVPNALDLRRYETHRTANDVPRLLFLGDLSAAKGLWELVQALGELRRRNVDCAADLVGEVPCGALGRRLHERLDSLGIRDRVFLRGRCYGEDKRRLLAQADVFVLPSHCESFCLANLEAMASGLPVVSTRTGAIPEVVRQGREGLLVDPGEASALTEALERLLRQPEQRRRMGQAARQRAADYDWTVVGQQLLDVYDGILGRRGTTLVSA
jgi:glycosyltransferase involved in cell wall biosynthesis